jgi:ADP-ribosyl-[dinitrogen reductase] hydrolase
MRLAPVALFFAPNQARAASYAGKSSRTTHAAPECVQACAVFGGMLVRALNGDDKTAVLAETNPDGKLSEKIAAIARAEYKQKTVQHIRGNGYVVDALEAALWCFWKAGSFAEAVLAAANLGDDADTTAAICGQIAGAFYGLAGIPDHWAQRVAMRAEILRLADRLAEH